VYNTCVSVSWVHRVVLHHEGCGNREDRSMRDGGVKMNKTEQKKDARSLRPSIEDVQAFKRSIRIDVVLAPTTLY